MKTFIRLCLSIIACSLGVSAMATNRFIVKYKQNKFQVAEKKIGELLKKIGVQVENSYVLPTGAHVIILNKDLDKKQTEQFINSFKQDDSIEYIEEDQIIHASSIFTKDL